jgi:hypothetical protein
MSRRSVLSWDGMELFDPERADLLADDRDLTVPAAAESLVAELHESTS